MLYFILSTIYLFGVWGLGALPPYMAMITAVVSGFVFVSALIFQPPRNFGCFVAVGGIALIHSAMLYLGDLDRVGMGPRFLVWGMWTTLATAISYMITRWRRENLTQWQNWESKCMWTLFSVMGAAAIAMVIFDYPATILLGGLVVIAVLGKMYWTRDYARLYAFLAS